MKRALTLLAGWGVMTLGSPGMLDGEGSLLLAILGVGVVGSVLARPLGDRPRRTLALDWAVGGLGASLALWWIYFVGPPALLYVGVVLGLYQLAAGWLMRRLGRGLGVGPAVAFGWMGAELLRTSIAPPFGLGWLQLGHHSTHHLWLSGSARVWGVEGLSLMVAALGGLLAQWIVERRLTKTALGLASCMFLLAVGFSALTAPPAMQPGPVALVVQPGLSQAQKAQGDHLDMMCALTLNALAEQRRKGGPAVDFVAWGESMLDIPQIEGGVADVIDQGGNLPAWRTPIDKDSLTGVALWQQEALVRPLLSRMPEGCFLLSGVEVVDVQAGALERYVGTALFDAHGRLGTVAKKRNLVSGGETMYGLERFAFVREITLKTIGYLPDFRPGAVPGILELPARDGRTYRISAQVCFDNAFVAPSVEAFDSGPVDFHTVTSNEAWYGDACEMDQMVAFGRLLALSTSRSMLRATNSGVSVLLGPDGREIERLRVDGKDRSVRGNLAVRIPVPADPGAGGPLYVGLRRFLRWGLALFLGALLWISRARSARSQGQPKRP